MQSPLFRKPVHKPISIVLVILALLVLGLAVIGLTSFLWVFPVLLIWLLFTSYGVFSIQSGVFISSINKINTNKPEIAITFDDGPHANTPAILDLLKAYNAKATFFVIGENAQNNPEILQRIAHEGHQIGNHTYTHSKLFPALKVSEMIEDIAKASIVIKKIIGKQPDTFRPPFGITNPSVTKAVKGLHLSVIGWSVRSLDTKIKNPEKVIRRIIKKTKPGSIILLHDYTSHSPEILEQILIHYSKMNYEFLTVKELSNA